MAVYEGIGSFLKGQAGDWSFYDRNRRTIARQKKNHVGKPKRTKKNMRVKTALANNVNAWRACNGALKKSYEDLKPSETCYNKFLSMGLHSTHIYLSKMEAEMGACVLVNFNVSMGSLRPVVSVTKSGDKLVSNIKVGSLSIDENTTVGEFTAAVLANNRLNRVRRFHEKDVINFLRFYQEFDSVKQMPFVEVGSANVTLISTGNEGSEVKLRELVGEDGFEVVNGCLAASEVEHTMVAWIQSRLGADDQKMVTTQDLVGDNEELIARYSSEEAFLKAAASYGKFNDEDNFRPSDNDYDQSEDDGDPTGPDPNGQVTLTCSVVGGGGSVSPASQTVNRGEQVTFTATPDSGKRVRQWSTGATGNTLTVTATEDKSYTVSFENVSSGGGDLR